MTSIKKILIAAGVSYLIIFLTGFFSNFYVLQSIYNPTDASKTIENIIKNESLFRSGTMGFLIMVIADFFLAWLLYLLLKTTDEKLSLLAAWLRLVNAAIFAIALYNLLSILHIINETGFSIDQLQVNVMFAFTSFNYTWLIGLVFFGLHLIVLGYLIIRSDFIPKLIGILLVIAGVGYLIDSSANVLLSNYKDYQDTFMLIVLLPGIIGELSFTAWLIYKGFTYR